MTRDTLTDEARRELFRCADQARACGKLSTAEWYKHWATYGQPNGPKPNERGRQYAGTAE
jgi:hypothetical protein